MLDATFFVCIYKGYSLFSSPSKTIFVAGSVAEKKNVVVIGGGVAGSLVAKSLQNEAAVFLIVEKEYFEITWASLRSMVEPEFAKRSVISHSEYLPHAKIVISAAVNIADTDVFTTQGSRIRYDCLVVATGRTKNSAWTKTEKISQYQTDYEKIKSAKSILIVGGGPTGVELAAEIAVDFPDKKVTWCTVSMYSIYHKIDQ
ncbi:hypothetical protein T459_29782 [Capsicum annuum]|uniref:FAD/NAD(P)-binding domain-containing protein n=1 Tax=Capsicum annuum TaxID=4072 RepID=A0A2G2Y6H4_CAPAN|nr:hypothetical protein T459_29782 [Capsicum annuum]